MEQQRNAKNRISRSRRPLRDLSAQQLMHSVLFHSVDNPWKTVRLEPDILTNYCQKPTSLNLSVAEIYHENSKLSMQPVGRPTLDVPFNVFREQYIRRRRAVLETMQFSTLDLPSLYRDALSAGGRALERDVWYAVGLRAVFVGLMADYEPLAETLRVVKELTESDVSRLQTALNPARGVAVDDPDNSLLLLVIGSFARNEVLYGARGYRQTLLEAGRLIESILQHAKEFGLLVEVGYDFVDREVDAVMEADGTEQGTLAFISLRLATGGESGGGQ